MNDIYAPIEKDLKAFSLRLRQELVSEDELIGGIHAHILKMSGKFLRPAVAIFSSKILNSDGGPSDTRAVELAVAIELIHTATLVHDDIIDDSELRRNQPSVYSKWGREISIVSGDYLYAKAFLLLAGVKDVWISQAFAACAHHMCEGEMKQIERRNHFLTSEAEYLKIIHQKTAALFQAACMGGAYLAGTDKARIQKLGDYGYRLGMAFQIVDDCLDIIGETESLGKTTGVDVVKNDISLPLLYLFEELNEADREALALEIRSRRPGLLEKTRRLVLEKKSVEKAMGKARYYVEGCLENLRDFEDSVYKDSLSQLACYCVERVR